MWSLFHTCQPFENSGKFSCIRSHVKGSRDQFLGKSVPPISRLKPWEQFRENVGVARFVCEILPAKGHIQVERVNQSRGWAQEMAFCWGGQELPMRKSSFHANFHEAAHPALFTTIYLLHILRVTVAKSCKSYQGYPGNLTGNMWRNFNFC